MLFHLPGSGNVGTKGRNTMNAGRAKFAAISEDDGLRASSDP